jgi:hypothetical protein
METLRRSWLVPLTVLAGVAWIAGVLLVATQADSDPVGSRYDAYNRVLTLALALLLASGLAIRGRVREAGAAGGRALTVLVAGLALMLAGNTLEFWGSLAAGAEAAATAERLGLEEEFWGSFPGFLVFLLGGLLVLASLIAYAIRIGAWAGISRLQRVAIGAGGLLMVASTALWAVSPAAALVPAVLFAFAWLLLATAAAGLTSRAAAATTEAPREGTASQRTP